MFTNRQMDEMEPRCGTGFGKKLMFLMIGGGIGATLALLFAPKAGNEIRADLVAAAGKGYDETLEAAHKLKLQTAEYYRAARAKGADALEAMADKVAVVKDEVAVDAIKLGNIVESGAKRAADSVRVN